MMSKTIAIFGAGSGLGTSVALRFGREGYKVALVARRREPLEALAARLALEKVEAHVFQADLSLPDRISAVVSEIVTTMGSIDVVEYAPVAVDQPIPATQLDVPTLQHLLNLYLLTPIALVKLVLPGMVERGNGGILVGLGASALESRPFMSGLGPAMAAARNYFHTLHGEVADKGIYVGAVLVTAVIQRSASHQALASGELSIALPEGMELPAVDPDLLANEYWNLYARRDRVESIYPPFPQTMEER
jgi:short-subunit dehydrogenase